MFATTIFRLTTKNIALLVAAIFRENIKKITNLIILIRGSIYIELCYT